MRAEQTGVGKGSATIQENIQENTIQEKQICIFQLQNLCYTTLSGQGRAAPCVLRGITEQGKGGILN